MPLLNASLQKQVRDALAGMTSPVVLAVFVTDTDKHACEICADTRQLVEELAWLSDGTIRTQVYDLEKDSAQAAAYGVDKAPAVVVLGGGDPPVNHGIRFFGIPSGYEFATLIEDIKMVSAGEAQLSTDTREALSRLALPLHIQVFVTPTCPYCPRAVQLAHKLALASPLVTADMVDASEFPDLSDRHGVRAVPRTVVNDTIHVEGAVPEEAFLEELEPLLAPSAVQA
jgi:glutaredoxin-like protein